MSSFERLFGDGRDLEQAKGILALDAAAQTGDAAQVLELIRRGADVNQKSSEDGATPLHYAAEHGHLDAARALLDHGAQVDVRAGPHQTPHGLVGQGNTPLIFAAAEGHCEIIELLLDRGASIDMSNTVGSSTPLFLAAQRGRTRAVEVLLRRGADLSLKTDRGVLPLHIAAEHGYLEIVKLLLAYCPPGTEKLFERRPAEINMVLYGHRTPADVPTFYDHDTPLHDAAQNGHEEIVALMLERGANPNSVDRIGNTPLHVASHSGHAAVVRRLVAGGADASIKNNAGHSAADLACQRPGADAALKDLIIATLRPSTAKAPTDLGASDSNVLDAAPASDANVAGLATAPPAAQQTSMADQPKQGLYPNLIDAKEGALMVGLLFNGDHSEGSLGIVDLIMTTADLLRQDADAATAAIRKTFPYEHLGQIERLLRIAAQSDRRCLALCGGYAGEVACRNLGATWSERDGAAGVEFKERRRFVPLLELCTSGQYAALKAELAGGASHAAAPREAIPATPQARTVTSQPVRATQRPTPTKSEPGRVWWVMHYIVAFPSLLFKIFLGGFFGASIGTLPLFILERAIHGDSVSPGGAPVLGIVISIVGIAGLAAGAYLGFKSGFAKYKQGLDPLD